MQEQLPDARGRAMQEQLPDARGRAMQEQLPDARGTSPWMGEVEQRRSSCRGQRRSSCREQRRSNCRTRWPATYMDVSPGGFPSVTSVARGRRPRATALQHGPCLPQHIDESNHPHPACGHLLPPSGRRELHRRSPTPTTLIRLGQSPAVREKGTATSATRWRFSPNAPRSISLRHMRDQPPIPLASALTTAGVQAPGCPAQQRLLPPLRRAAQRS